jgi:hypothetical protein
MARRKDLTEVEYHTKEMNYYKRFDKDMYRYHRNELRRLRCIAFTQTSHDFS